MLELKVAAAEEITASEVLERAARDFVQRRKTGSGKKR
jgi:hypothetical protein